MKAERMDEPWGGVPVRAAGDRRLTELHFRALIAIASHDRFSKHDGGDGCFAGNKKLAEVCNCNRSNLSTAINELVRWGYVESAKHPIFKRQNVYRVIYDILPTDKQSVSNAGRSNSLPRGNSLPAKDNGLPTGNNIVRPAFSQAYDEERISGSQYNQEDNHQYNQLKYPVRYGRDGSDGGLGARLDQQSRALLNGLMHHGPGTSSLVARRTMGRVSHGDAVRLLGNMAKSGLVIRRGREYQITHEGEALCN